MSNHLLASGQPDHIILYQAADGKVTVHRFSARGSNFWLPQRARAATVAKMETVQIEGDSQP